MFAGDENLLNLIQTEAIILVDGIIEESVTVVNNNSSTLNQSSFAQESEGHDELSHQMLIDENNYDHQQQFQLPLINVNNCSSNFDQAHSDEISDNFAIKSDCDIIVKSPTIESMSGKSFEDVDDECNYDNTAANISTMSPLPTKRHQSSDDSDSDNENRAQSLVEEILQETVYEQSALSGQDGFDSDDSISNKVRVKAQNLVDEVLQTSLGTVENTETITDGKKSVSFHESPVAMVRNIAEPVLKRVERKFEHLSSEVREDDPDSIDLEQIDDLVNKEDISLLQSDFSKISWDESLSPTTGELGLNTPDNDLPDGLSFPGDTSRH